MPEQNHQLQENTAQQPPQPLDKEKKKKPSWILWVVLVVILLLIGGGTYYYFFYKEKQDTGNGADQTTPVTTEESTTDSDEETNSDTEAQTGSETTSIDDTWNLYTNYDHGFSIKIPKKFYAYSGTCYYSTDNGDHSYRPDSKEVPLVVLENDNEIHFVNESFCRLSGETEENGRHFFSEYEELDTTIDMIGDTDYEIGITGWTLTAIEISNESELETFIQSKYGSGCSLGELSETDQQNVYDVTISGSDLGAEDPQCPLDSWMILKYNTDTDTLVYWNAGTGVTYMTVHPDDAEDLDNFDWDYGTEMIESFQFI